MAMDNNVADVAERIAHFREITGVADPQECSQILEAHGWNLDQAVNTVLAVSDGDGYGRRRVDEEEMEPLLDGEDGGGSGSRAIRGNVPTGQEVSVGGHGWVSRTETGNGTAIANGYGGGLGAYERRNGGRGGGTGAGAGAGAGGVMGAAGPGGGGGVVASSFSTSPGGLVWRLLTLPGAVVWGGLGLVTGVVGLGLRFARGGISLGVSTLGSLAGMVGVGGGYDRIASREDASEGQRFLQRFEEEYGVVHPAFSTTTFMDAVRTAATEFRFLFVYLHSAEHVSTPGFCREVLCSPSVVEFLRENFVVWGGDVRGVEGFQMTHNMKASTFPYMAVVTGLNGGPNSRVTMLYQKEGEVTAEELIRDLARVIEERGAMLEAAREQEERRALDRMIREEQDALYMASLREDQERERRRQEEIERQRREAEEEERKKKEEEEAARLAAQRAQERERMLEQRRREKQESLGPEPEKGPNVTQVLIRLPDGQRLERRFHSTATVQAIYDYVDSAGSLKTENYTLVTNFPRMAYGPALRKQSLVDAGLHPQASLFVQEEG